MDLERRSRGRRRPRITDQENALIIIAWVSKEPLGRLTTEPDGVMRMSRMELRLPPIVDVGCACSEAARDMSIHRSAAELGVRQCSA